jgi:hypothetical protein
MNQYEFRTLTIIVIILLLTTIFPAPDAGRMSLEEDISDGYLDEYTKIEAAFILSGVTEPDSLKLYLDWYERLLSKIQSFSFDLDDRIGSAQTVFMYLHAEWLITYALESTTLADIVRRKEYNCVAATILYNIICEDLDWSVEAFETPSHVYTIFKDFRRDFIIENTSSMGFDMLRNLQSYSRYLAQYYPQSEVLRIGLDQLYYHENSNGRVINNTELLGLLAYNRAYLARKNKDYGASYEYVLLAQRFNQDSRSNVKFEVGLYYAWGRQLYLKDNFMEAFTVFADGYYRYPNNEDFLNNTFTAFYKSLEDNWHKKNWTDSARLIEEILILEILQDNDHKNLQQILKNWRHYFSKINNDDSVAQVEEYIKKFVD